MAAEKRCCDRRTVGKVSIVAGDKTRLLVSWCEAHPVWALRTVADLMVENVVFPGSKLQKESPTGLQTERLDI